ncbi:MAG TPA: glycosyltransferase family 2 protein [Planctomycetota bacterium]|nr:glycosyltransferase family 2 protein [Planctomycetota bacterium]
MQLSVVICTLNRQNIIQRTLYALSQCTFERPWELLVVDNGGEDHTRAIVQSFDRFLPVSYQREPRRGKFHALNRAIALAASDRLIFLDDDILVRPDFLQVYSKAFDDHPEMALFGGPVELDLPPDHDADLVSVPQAHAVLAQSDYGPEPRELKWPHCPIGGNMAVRRDLLSSDLVYQPIRQHGFTMEFALEDLLFCKRVMALGQRAMYLPQARVRHIVRPEQLRLGYFSERYAHALIGQEILDEIGPTRQWLNVPRYHLRRLIFRAARFIRSLPSDRRKRLASYIDFSAALRIVRYYQKREVAR